MFEYRECRPGHLALIQAQDSQRLHQVVLISGEYADIACNGKAYSMWLNSRCLAAAGIVPLFSHRAVAWALLSPAVGPYMLTVVRKMRSFLAHDPTPRIEMTVRHDFAQGHRFALALGMQLETPEPLRKYGASGEDEMLYARIR